MTAQLVIDAHRISKSYGKGSGRFDALKNVTLQVRRGECVAIVGKSGSGKSTLMQGITLIIVTHDEELAARCDRQVFHRDGVIVSGLGTTGAAA